jgi:tetratricopeptide (TPR) repeat protein
MLNGDYEKAVADMIARLRLIPVSPQVMPVVAKHIGSAESSIAPFAISTEQSRSTRSSRIAFDKRGLVHSERHDYARAVEDFDRALALDPTNYGCFASTVRLATRPMVCE